MYCLDFVLNEIVCIWYFDYFSIEESEVDDCSIGIFENGYRNEENTMNVLLSSLRYSV